MSDNFSNFKIHLHFKSFFFLRDFKPLKIPKLVKRRVMHGTSEHLLFLDTYFVDLDRYSSICQKIKLPVFKK